MIPREFWDKLSPELQYQYAEMLVLSLQDYMREVREPTLTVRGTLGAALGEYATIYADDRKHT